jgi:heme-binding protein
MAATAPRRAVRHRLRLAAIVAIGGFLLIQVVPYGRDHTNPPVTRAVRWDSARTEQLAARACGDCHSNLTKWPWYTNVAPGSWLVAQDVNGGREELNFSEWDRGQPSIDEVVEAVDGGGMPPLQYKLIHSSSRLSAKEKQELIDGLRRTWAADPPSVRSGGGG